MKLFANIREIAKILFRQNGQEIGLDSNTSTTYTADRNVELPPGDADSILVGAASTQTLTNKTIDGDDNTVQDLPITALKTVLGDADKVLLRDASGVPTSAKIVNANIDAAAAIDATKIGNGDVDNTELSKLNGVSGNITTDTNTQTLTNKTLTSPVINTPTGIVKGDVGLGNVDNTSDSTKNSAAVTLTNKTIDGDDNTVQDLALTSIKTVIGDADKVIRRNASGVIISDNAIPNSSEILTTDATQIISNKELDQAVMNGQIVPDYTDMDEVAAPGNPTAGRRRYYTKADGFLYSRNNAGVETSVGSAVSPATSTTLGTNYGSTESTSRTMTNVGGLGTVTTNLQHFETFRTPSGQWKLKFSLSLLCSSTTSANLFEFSISDVTFKNSSDFNQPLGINLSVAGPGQSQAIQAFTKPNTNEIRIYTTGNVQPNLYYWNLSGEVLLESQPSWA